MQFSNKEHFYEELDNLKSAFEKLQPELELTVRDASLGMEGYVIVWNTIDDPTSSLGRCAKGGTRISPEISVDEIKMLAKTMALKNAAAGLPLGGAKSGVKADPDAPGFEKVYRSFVSSVKPILKENGGIFGGFGFDIGARPIHPAWACDELGSGRSFTGKPVEMGGTDYDKEGIAGLGVAVAAKTMLDTHEKNLAETTFAVQGLGAMGAAVVRYFSEYGAKLSAISDPRIGGTYLIEEASKELIDSIITQEFDKTCEFLSQSKATSLGLDDVLYQNVDVLFPCAVQDVVDSKNVERIKAKYVVEGANNPSSDEAKTMLFERGIHLIPDFIANPGGIIAAFVELSSNISAEENARTKQNVIDAKALTEKRIRENVNTIIDLSRQLQVEFAHAGKFVALTNMLKL